MEYIGDISEDQTVNVYFTTNDGSGGAVAPSTAFEAADIAIYKDNSATQKATANGLTMTSPFDAVVGLHLITIDTSNDTGDAGFWVTGSDYTVVLNPDETVDSQTVVSVLAQFSIQNRYMRGTDSAALASVATEARLAELDAANLPADVDAILVDTAEIGTAGAGLTNINLPDQTMNIIGNITGNLSGSIGSLGATAKTDVNTEADTALSDFFTSSAQLVDDVWDEVITGAAHNVNNSSARFLREASEATGVTGTATAGGATSITLAAGESASSNIYAFERVRIIEGTGAGQSRLITAYDGGTKVATVDRAWTVNPSTDSVYVISSADATLEAIGTQLVSATATVDFDDLAATLADTNELQGDWANGGRLDLIIDELTTQGDTNETKIDTIDTNVDTLIVNVPDVISLANINAQVDTAFTTQMADSVSTDGTIATREQALYMVLQMLTEFAISGTTYTVKKVDGSTTLMTFTLDDGTNPTSLTRAT